MAISPDDIRNLITSLQDLTKATQELQGTASGKGSGGGPTPPPGGIYTSNWGLTVPGVGGQDYAAKMAKERKESDEKADTAMGMGISSIRSVLSAGGASGSPLGIGASLAAGAASGGPLGLATAGLSAIAQSLGEISANNASAGNSASDAFLGAADLSKGDARFRAVNARESFWNRKLIQDENEAAAGSYTDAGRNFHLDKAEAIEETERGRAQNEADRLGPGAQARARTEHEFDFIARTGGARDPSVRANILRFESWALDQANARQEFHDFLRDTPIPTKPNVQGGSQRR